MGYPNTLITDNTPGVDIYPPQSGQAFGAYAGDPIGTANPDHPTWLKRISDEMVAVQTQLGLPASPAAGSVIAILNHKLDPAPSDGFFYEQQQGLWTKAIIQAEAPTDSALYVRKNTVWSKDPIQSDVPDASLYNRQLGGWIKAVIQAEAPSDGAFYSRQNAGWAKSIIQTEAPVDGKAYARQNAGWAAAPAEAPTDGKAYARQSAAWTPAPAEAPSDGNLYSRKNAAWTKDIVQAEAPMDSALYIRQNGAWVKDVIQTDAADASLYSRTLGAWTKAPIQTDAVDASLYCRQLGGWLKSPIQTDAADASLYSRSLGAWTKTPIQADAPSDGQTYGRLGAAGGSWSPVLPSAGGALTGGINFGSVFAGSVTDLSKHLALYSTTYGLDVTNGFLNLVTPSTGALSFYTGTTEILRLTSTQVLPKTGLSFGGAVASGPTDLSKHITLNSGGWGFSITASSQNYVGAAGANAGHHFYNGTVDVFDVLGSGLIVTDSGGSGASLQLAVATDGSTDLIVTSKQGTNSGKTFNVTKGYLSSLGYAITAASFVMPAYGSTVTVNLSASAPGGGWMAVNRYVRIDGCGMMQITAYSAATPSVTLKNTGFRGNALPGMSIATAAWIVPYMTPAYLNGAYVCDEFQHAIQATPANGGQVPGPVGWIFNGTGTYRSAGSQGGNGNPGSGLLAAPASLSTQSGSTSNYGIFLLQSYPLYARLRFRMTSTNSSYFIGFVTDLFQNNPQSGFWVTYDTTTNTTWTLITQNAGTQTGSTPLGLSIFGGSTVGGFIFAFDGTNLNVFYENGNTAPILAATIPNLLTSLVPNNIGVFFSMYALAAGSQLMPDIFELYQPAGNQTPTYNSRYLFGP